MLQADQVAMLDKLDLGVGAGDVGRLLVPLLDDEHVVLVFVRVGRYLNRVGVFR